MKSTARDCLVPLVYIAGCQYFSMASALLGGVEARVRRVLDTTHIDASVLEHLETIAAVFDTGDASPPAGGASRAPAGLRAELDKRSLMIAQNFLTALAPVEAHVTALVDAVDALSESASAALARAANDERVSAAFLAAAGDTAAKRACPLKSAHARAHVRSKRHARLPRTHPTQARTCRPSSRVSASSRRCTRSGLRM